MHRFDVFHGSLGRVGWRAALTVGLLGLSTGLVPARAAMTAASLLPGDALVADGLEPDAARLTFRMGRKDVTGSKVDRELLPSVRAALNGWAATADELRLEIAVPEHAPALVLGRADEDDVHRAAKVLDDAWEVLHRLLPDDGADVPATVAVLFDLKGMRSDAFGTVLDVLVARNLLRAEDAGHMRADPCGLTMRGVPLFLQPTWDMVGNAAGGDDEFRLDNEVAAKFTQCVMTRSFGQLPGTLLWGTSFLVEQRLFGTCYAFDSTGFVASSTHFDWGVRTSKALDDKKSNKDFSIVPLVLKGQAGVAEPPQMMVWGALDHLWAKDADLLAALFVRLGELHEQADPYGGRPSYAGAEEETLAALHEAFDEIDAKSLSKHVKKLK